MRKLIRGGSNSKSTPFIYNLSQFNKVFDWPYMKTYHYYMTVYYYKPSGNRDFQHPERGFMLQILKL